MKLWIALFLFIWTSSATAITLDGQETQNGAGASEQHFAYAFAILKPLLSQCLSSNVCLDNAEQKNIVKSIIANFDKELANKDLLQFQSGKESKFFLDGQVRIAVTGLTAGAPIYINRDLIYRMEEWKLTPFTVSEAISLLVHELGHHQGILEHERLDLLGAKLRLFFEMNQDQLRVDTFAENFYDADISLTVFHTRQTVEPFNHNSIFWLNVNDQVFDLNSELRKKLECPLIDRRPASLLGYRFSHLRWNEKIGHYINRSHRIVLPLEARVWLECYQESKSGPPIFVIAPHRIQIDFSFYPDEHKLRFIENSLKVWVGERIGL